MPKQYPLSSIVHSVSVNKLVLARGIAVRTIGEAYSSQLKETLQSKALMAGPFVNIAHSKLSLLST